MFEWTVGNWISAFTLLISLVIGIATWVITNQQKRLQLFQARQALRNSARAWADEVVAVLQDGITHCFIFKQNSKPEDTALHFTRLAGKISELIDRGRWHFENDKESGFGRSKEGAYQGLAPSAIEHLKCAHEYLVDGANTPANRECCFDHLRKNLTGKKRAFVSVVQNFVQPSHSISELGF